MENRLREKTLAALREAGADENDAGQVELTIPPDPAFGDLTTNAALIFGRKFGRPPRELAAAVAAALASDPDVASATVAGPGFVNLRLRDVFILKHIQRALQEGDSYGSSDHLRDQSLQVEFVSANPTGPLNAVNARAAAYGDALARCLSFLGAAVHKEYLVNDVGTQIELLGQSLRVRRRQDLGQDACLPPEGYAGAYVIELARDLAGQINWEADDVALGTKAAEVIVAGQRQDLAAFGVNFDRWFHQRELYPDKIEDALRLLRQRGAVYHKDGATWLTTAAAGDDEDRVVVRNNGQPTYFMADIAYHLDKYRRGFSKAIDVLGPDHHGHQKKMYAMTRLLGIPEGWLEIIISQQVNLLAEGVKVKMSKRAGHLVTLRELIDAIGVDAARFFFLTRSPSAHLDFDLALARKQTPENPVYYAQYCHARVESIKREGPPVTTDFDLGALSLPEERLLARTIWELPAIAYDAAVRRQPHHLVSYVIRLAGLFHNYYHHHRVLQAPSAAKAAARLALVAAVGQTVKNALALVGVSAPDRM